MIQKLETVNIMSKKYAHTSTDGYSLTQRTKTDRTDKKSDKSQKFLLGLSYALFVAATPSSLD